MHGLKNPNTQSAEKHRKENKHATLFLADLFKTQRSLMWGKAGSDMLSKFQLTNVTGI